jgi:hypothetical protein
VCTVDWKVKGAKQPVVAELPGGRVVGGGRRHPGQGAATTIDESAVYFLPVDLYPLAVGCNKAVYRGALRRGSSGPCTHVVLATHTTGAGDPATGAAFIRREAALLDTLGSTNPYTERVFVHCGSNSNQSAGIPMMLAEQVVPLDTLLSHRTLPLLSLPLRLHLAQSVLASLSLFDDFTVANDAGNNEEASVADIRGGRRTPVIFGDMGVGQFGVTRSGDVKVVDILSKKTPPYPAGQPLLSDLPCSDRSTCEAESHRLHALARFRTSLDDFACVVDRGTCHGLDHRTHDAAACRLILTPLLNVSSLNATDVPPVSLRRTLDDVLVGLCHSDPLARMPRTVAQARLAQVSIATGKADLVTLGRLVDKGPSPVVDRSHGASKGCHGGTVMGRNVEEVWTSWQ